MLVFSGSAGPIRRFRRGVLINAVMHVISADEGVSD
jgi:hypothetical protein